MVFCFSRGDNGDFSELFCDCSLLYLTTHVKHEQTGVLHELTSVQVKRVTSDHRVSDA